MCVRPTSSHSYYFYYCIYLLVCFPITPDPPSPSSSSALPSLPPFPLHSRFRRFHSLVCFLYPAFYKHHLTTLHILRWKNGGSLPVRLRLLLLLLHHCNNSTPQEISRDGSLRRTGQPILLTTVRQIDRNIIIITNSLSTVNQHNRLSTRCRTLSCQSLDGLSGLPLSRSAMAKDQEHQTSPQAQNSSCGYNLLKDRY